MKPSRARTILLRRLGFLEAKIALGGVATYHDHDEAKALRVVLDLDQHDEERVVESRQKVTPKIVRRASSAELLGVAVGVLRAIQTADVAGVLARIEKERAS